LELINKEDETSFDEYQRFTSYQEAIDSLVPFTELTTNQEWDKSIKKEMSIFRIDQLKTLLTFKVNRLGLRRKFPSGTIILSFTQSFIAN